MTEPNLDELDIQAFLESICRGNYDEDGVCLWDLAELRDGIEALIANQVREARSDLVETICDIEATREAEGKDFISYKAFKRIKSLAGLDNG